MNEQATTSTVFVFDLDGVITNPNDGSVDHEAVGHIHALLENGTYVAVNTGRSYQWVEANLLAAIEKLGGSSQFNHLFIACEKGGESIQWQGSDFVPRPSKFALSESIQRRSHQLYQTNADSLSSMFWDDTKLTMATIEKRPASNIDQFKTEQRRLVALLQQAFGSEAVRIDATTIATDIESPQAGKHAGAELIYDWVATQTDSPVQRFISFGDSRSDYEMARHFAQKDCDSTFVFVGAKTDTFEETPSVRLVRTNAAYAAGTREYFKLHG